jgi:hypothetical protein
LLAYPNIFLNENIPGIEKVEDITPHFGKMNASNNKF